MEPNYFEINRGEQQGARRSPVGKRREPPLVWQGEMLYCVLWNSSMVEEVRQLRRRVVLGPRYDVFVETSFSGGIQCCCRLCTTAVVAEALRWNMTVGRQW